MSKWDKMGLVYARIWVIYLAAMVIIGCPLALIFNSPTTMFILLAIAILSFVVPLLLFAFVTLFLELW